MLATWLIDHLMCRIYVGLPKGQFLYVITFDQHVIHRRTRVITGLPMGKPSRGLRFVCLLSFFFLFFLFF